MNPILLYGSFSDVTEDRERKVLRQSSEHPKTFQGDNGNYWSSIQQIFVLLLIWGFPDYQDNIADIVPGTITSTWHTDPIYSLQQRYEVDISWFTNEETEEDQASNLSLTPNLIVCFFNYWVNPFALSLPWSRIYCLVWKVQKLDFS